LNRGHILSQEVQEGKETIQYRDVIHSYICKYGKFLVGHHVINLGDTCEDIDAFLKKEGLIKCLQCRLNVISPRPTI
jgi:hypothetical protein